MLALLLFSCNPWTEVHEREQAWYDADRIESELGIDLVEISAGEPVGYWPRMVIRQDRIELDNRAWFLNLPDTFFLSEDLDHEAREGWLMEPTVVLSLEAGRYKGKRGFDGLSIPELVVELEGFAQMRKFQWRWLDDHSQSRGKESTYDLFDPNLFTLVVEPGVPWETVFPVMFSAGQATFDPPLLVGRVGDRLRTPMAGRRVDTPKSVCVMYSMQRVGPQSTWIELQGLPPLVGPEGCEASDWGASLDVLESVLDYCTPRWQAELAELRFDPGGELSDWACTQLIVDADPETDAQTMLVGMAQNYQAYPRIDQITAVMRPDESTCQEGKQVSELEPALLDGFCDRSNLANRIEYWGDPRVLFETAEVAPLEPSRTFAGDTPP